MRYTLDSSMRARVLSRSRVRVATSGAPVGVHAGVDVGRSDTPNVRTSRVRLSILARAVVVTARRVDGDDGRDGCDGRDGARRGWSDPWRWLATTVRAKTPRRPVEHAPARGGGRDQLCPDRWRERRRARGGGGGRVRAGGGAARWVHARGVRGVAGDFGCHRG